MDFTFVRLHRIAFGSLCIGMLGCAAAVFAEERSSRPVSLPDLPGADVAPGHFALDEHAATLGYHSRVQKWSATLDEYSFLDPGLKVDYGMLLTNEFGAGAALTHRGDYSEMLVNGVFAPRRDLRFGIAGGQLRGGDAGSDAVTQNSYMVGVKKNAFDVGLLSDFGMSAYTVRAVDTEALTAMGDAGMGSDVSGRLDGYMLNFGLQPTPYSRIELERERSQFSYRYGDSYHDGDYADVNHVRYLQYLGNCARFHGNLSAGENWGRLDLGLSKSRWNVGVSHAVDGSSRDVALQVGYTIPLGRSGNTVDECASSAPVFGALVDAAVRRPGVLPSGPITNAIP